MKQPVLHFRRESAGLSARVSVRGVPSGTVIPKGYLSHQIWRLSWSLGPATRRPRGADVVLINRGSSRTFELGLRPGAPGKRSSRLLESGLGLMFRQVALDVASLTLVRKILEDRRIFVGSRVIDPSLEDPVPKTPATLGPLAPLFSASCGAYKVTEQADRSPKRIIRFDIARRPARRSRRANRTFELLISGPFGWNGRTAKRRRDLERRLARALLALPPIESVSTEFSLTAGGSLAVLRLRSGLGQVRTSGPVRLAFLSVLSESLVVGVLAECVAGYRLVGLPPSDRFRLQPGGRPARPAQA